VEVALVIAVSRRVRALVRAATLLVTPDLAEVQRDQPAAEEAIAWGAVASAVEGAAVEAAEEAEAEAEDKQTDRMPGEQSDDMTFSKSQ
jgi:ribosomal protein L12E/L44/L45/RPP1/RPP2